MNKNPTVEELLMGANEPKQESSAQRTVRERLNRVHEIFESEGQTADKGEKLFNSAEPSHGVLHEQPEHRLMIWMKSQGASNREIARQLGYSEPWVSQVLRQPWARERIVNILKDAGGDELGTILKGAAADSLHTLIDLRDTSLNPAVRRAAADSLLDRYLGKPTQHVETKQAITVSQSSLTDIDREIATYQAEINRLAGTLTN